MITHLKGRLAEKNPTDVVIDCNGIGYLVHISLHTYSQIPDQESVSLYTYLQVKEDAHHLFGFSTKMERELFKLLLSVSGVGASTARTMLSSLSPDQIKEAIANADVPLIQSVKGIGAKTAQRVILDLKDKVIKVYGIEEVSTATGNTNREEALSALEVLGFNKKQAEKVVQKIVSQDSNAPVEQIIKEALKKL